MKRKFIKERVQEVLKSAKIDDIGDSVYLDRVIPSDVDELPLVLIYSKDISVDTFDEAPKSYLKVLSLVIEVVSQHDNSECLIDDLDEISYKVEKAIENDVDLEKELERVELKGVDYTVDGSGDVPMGSARVNYSFSYIEQAKSDLILPDLKRINVTTKINGNETGASDTIDL